MTKSQEYDQSAITGLLTSCRPSVYYSIDEEIPQSAFPNGTARKLAALSSLLHSVSLMQSVKQGSCKSTIFIVIGLSRLGIKTESTAPDTDGRFYHSAI